MKKLILLSFISLALSIASCSKNDDNNGDDIFDAPFYPLKDLKDLDSNVWLYKGAKFGDRKFGYISSKFCIAQNIIAFTAKNENQKFDELNYYSYGEVGALCEIEFRSTLVITEVSNAGVKGRFSKLLAPPVLSTLSEEKNKKVPAELESKDLSQSVNIDIGYQAGMLRIEDKLTKYEGKEKVYLYFQKM